MMPRGNLHGYRRRIRNDGKLLADFQAKLQGLGIAIEWLRLRPR